MVEVLVMLSTYNGERYIKEQLDSLYRQKDVNIHILVRDDGSTDGTVSILEKYMSAYGKMTIHAEENIGCKRSFYKLIQMASTMEASFDYYAFCDQDDIWDEDKLISAVGALDKSDNEYKLYYSEARCVDDNMNLIKVRPIMTNGSLVANIISSHSLGCTQVFNRSVLTMASLINDVILPSILPDGYIPQHDAWTLISAQCLDGYVYHDPTAHINYRQHANNVVGGGSTSRLTILKRRLKRHLSHPNMRSRLALYVLTVYGKFLSDDAHYMVNLLANYRDNVKNRFRLIFSKTIKTDNMSIDFPMRIMILIGRF